MKNGVRRTKLHQKHVSSLFLERHCVFSLSLSLSAHHLITYLCLLSSFILFLSPSIFCFFFFFFFFFYIIFFSVLLMLLLLLLLPPSSSLLFFLLLLVFLCSAVTVASPSSSSSFFFFCCFSFLPSSSCFFASSPFAYSVVSLHDVILLFFLRLSPDCPCCRCRHLRRSAALSPTLQPSGHCCSILFWPSSLVQGLCVFLSSFRPDPCYPPAVLFH